MKAWVSDQELDQLIDKEIKQLDKVIDRETRYFNSVDLLAQAEKQQQAVKKIHDATNEAVMAYRKLQEEKHV